ncbi:hypothetical protein RHGRI_007077 [Rhododendron griersonianum]|uniref:RING-type domain-containing protein n=1 Tax=Rhododendron griersonianum TaxID=479676 RepID=A0AAV6KVS5_9ERIC|nr:hypothetical protein RHGRI_007077 [Rhododendron griersonianum]
MLKFHHSFHLSCINVWLRKQSTCPICWLPSQETLGIKHIGDFDGAFSTMDTKRC